MDPETYWSALAARVDIDVGGVARLGAAARSRARAGDVLGALESHLVRARSSSRVERAALG
eukprot:5668055-Pyramimonas_sp.AAC.1